MFNVHGCSVQGDLKILRTQLDCSWRFHYNRLNGKGQVGLGVKGVKGDQGGVKGELRGIKGAGSKGQVETRIPLVAGSPLLWVVLLVAVL